METPQRGEGGVTLGEVFQHQKAVALVGDPAPAQVPNDAAGVERVAEPAAALDALVPLPETHRVWDRQMV